MNGNWVIDAILMDLQGFYWEQVMIHVLSLRHTAEVEAIYSLYVFYVIAGGFKEIMGSMDSSEKSSRLGYSSWHKQVIKDRLLINIIEF